MHTPIVLHAKNMWALRVDVRRNETGQGTVPERKGAVVVSMDSLARQPWTDMLSTGYRGTILQQEPCPQPSVDVLFDVLFFVQTITEI